MLDGATAVTPDDVERMLARIPASPRLDEIDALLEHAGSVLKTIETAYAEENSSWSADRRSLANRSIHEAFDAVNSAVLSLVVDRDIDGTMERLRDAVPVLRRAWVVQMLKVV